ncbi:hypothetical protein LCGC14_0734630 [marine sediment metagenome]|uniref:Uncharacterized protein n=1 Tax=marine sediment metagenome TaxID=412755 RepID=A0A0F9STQ3_9ZZZZ
MIILRYVYYLWLKLTRYYQCWWITCPTCRKKFGSSAREDGVEDCYAKLLTGRLPCRACRANAPEH